jgi:hypothetical protein
MTEEIIFAAAILTLASAILAALYGVARNASLQRWSRRSWRFQSANYGPVVTVVKMGGLKPDLCYEEARRSTLKLG